jgi:hypothetical protein
MVQIVRRVMARRLAASGGRCKSAGLPRPSGTEDIYKIYAESFRGEDHLRILLREAQDIVDRAPGKLTRRLARMRDVSEEDHGRSV